MIDYVKQIDLETGLKLIPILISFLLFILKMREDFNIFKKKQNVKIDLEILELIKKEQTLNESNLVNELKINISNIYGKLDYESKLVNLFLFLLGVLFLGGFSWWTIDLYYKYLSFTPWMLLTSFFAFLGFIWIFHKEKKRSTEQNVEQNVELVFFKVEVVDKKSFISGFSFFCFFGLFSWGFWELADGFTFWVIIPLAITLLGFTILLRCVRIRKGENLFFANLKFVSPNNTRYNYVGEIRNNQPDGFGRAFFENGDRYIGSWESGLIDGVGHYIWKDNTVYFGEWKQHKMNGSGVFFDTNEMRVIAGTFENDSLIQIYNENENRCFYCGKIKNNQELFISDVNGVICKECINSIIENQGKCD